MKYNLNEIILCIFIKFNIILALLPILILIVFVISSGSLNSNGKYVFIRGSYESTLKRTSDDVMRDLGMFHLKFLVN